MKLIDSYIIKRYLGTFFVMILLFIPIGIMVDLAEKIDKIKEKEVPLLAVFDYYIDFTWYFANLLFPIFLFLSVIWFTSRLANNTEVIAILSSGISFFRFLRPFLISATLIALFAFFAGMYIVPKSNQGFNDFRYKYLVKKEARNTDKVFLQINDDEFTPPLLTFLNGCWASESSEDVFFTNAINGDFYFKGGLKQEVWFQGFETMEAHYPRVGSGNKTWGGDLYRNKLGNKIRVNRINYSKVNCYNAGMTD